MRQYLAVQEFIIGRIPFYSSILITVTVHVCAHTCGALFYVCLFWFFRLCTKPVFARLIVLKSVGMGSSLLAYFLMTVLVV